MKKLGDRLLHRDWFWISLMAAIVVAFCGRVLFTDQIIRASDVITQFFWSARGMHEQTVIQYLKTIPSIFQAAWEPLNDGGRTLEGGWNAIGLLFYRYLILHFFPFPSGIAWLAVLSLLLGGIGTYLYCRLIGVGRFAACAAGLLFALCTENSSLINAGHIQKIEAISWFPWVLLLLEKAVRSGRLFHYSMAALLLAVQFFTMHWQISFYTCLAVGAYWIFSILSRRRSHAGEWRRAGRDTLFAAVMVVLFFTTTAMSFAPLFSWSQQSERGGGMSREEGMSWSMPPEEVLTFFVPGMFGLSRQEAGDVPNQGEVYYWGRMRFTQTSDYLGLLPWLLLPLPLLFRRDRYTWFFTSLMGVTLIMALGKYTLFYKLLFAHIPGFATFRVPKMILFLFAFGAAVLMGKGIDVLASGRLEGRTFRRYLLGCGSVAALLGLLWVFLAFGSETVLSWVAGFITVETRYQSGVSLVNERYFNMMRETGVAFGTMCAYLLVLYARSRRWLPSPWLPAVLLSLLLLDLWRVNDRFLVTTQPPVAVGKAAGNDVVRFLEPRIDHYRIQPLGVEDAHYYADYGFANISAYVTISEKRYREFLDAFSLAGGMPDMMNLKYLVVSSSEFDAQRSALAEKYTPVFTSSTGAFVLENRTVMPKAWLVPSVAVIRDAAARLAYMSAPRGFAPSRVGLVEAPPPLTMASPGDLREAGSATVQIYEPNRIVVIADAPGNSLLVLGEKYYRWWYARVDGKAAEIHPVNHILRGVYLQPGTHRVEFVFDPLPFKIGKYLTLASCAFFVAMIGREVWIRKRRKTEGCGCSSVGVSHEERRDH